MINNDVNSKAGDRSILYYVILCYVILCYIILYIHMYSE
jgi:hypothetical protein